MRFLAKYGLTVGCFLLISYSYTQTTTVSGKVYDASTKEPLPFVNISFKNSKIGTTTNLNGEYSIQTYYATDSLMVSFMGYISQSKAVRKDKIQVIDYALEEGSIQLSEVVIKATKQENPAHKILRNIIANKNINNREKLEAYQYETYNKVEFDVNNITEEYKNKRVFRPFQFVFDNIDTTEEKPFLPLYIFETISDYYYRKNPKSEKEIIKATKVVGVENESVSQFLGDMYQNVNIYNNYVIAFGKSFLSPIADFGRFSYKYYLTDSAFIGSDWCYQITFLPKRKNELIFEGDFWVHDTTYAIRKINASLATDANINFIHKFRVEQEYKQVEKEVWMLVKDKLIIDFTLTNRVMGFYGRKTTTYKDFVINQPKEDEFYFGAENIIVSDSALGKGDEFWQQSRHEKLTESEAKIYAMIDTIQKVPAFRTYVDIIQLFVLGYKIWGNFEIGPYFTMYSFNAIEGNRFRFGGRTSNKFSTRVMPEAYIAYGLKDQTFKYGGGAQYIITKKPRVSVGAYYKYDVEQLGQGDNAWRQDNLIASIFRRNPFDKLNGIEKYNAYFEKEWFQGLSNKIGFTRNEIWPLGNLTYDYYNKVGNKTDKHSLITSEISLYTRFAYKEKYVEGEFERTSLGTTYPIVQLQYGLGLKGTLDGEYDYQKLVLKIDDRIRINPFGFTDYIIEAGKIWGKLPYPLLELHNGNETYSYEDAAFNLMNYYEFVSDEYVSLSATHHFNGLFLNKIPLLKKLKWREVLSVKAVTGNLDDKCEDLLTFPSTLSALSKPYVEAGVGVENIFIWLRIDLLWRLSYLDHTDITKFGIRTKIQFDF